MGLWKGKQYVGCILLGCKRAKVGRQVFATVEWLNMQSHGVVDSITKENCC